MTHQHTHFIHVVAVVIFISFCNAWASAQPTQSVTVTIMVQTETGQALENVPLEMNSPTQSRFGFTDANGVLTVSLEITPGDDAIGVWLHSGFRYDPAVHDIVLAKQMYTFYREQYYFRQGCFAPIIPNQNTYSIPITAYPIVHVTGDATPPGPQEQWFPNSVSIFVRDGLWSGSVDPITQFSIPVRRGVDSELFISMYDSPLEQIVMLTAAQTLNDVNLGNINLSALASDAVAQITMNNAQDRWGLAGTIPLWRGVTLISSDGLIILSYPARKDDGFVVGNPDSLVDPDQSPSLPSGTYYVAPGFIVLSNDVIHMALLDAIRAGQLAALDAAGVPKFTAVAGQTTQFTFDAVLARNAILAATSQAP